MAALPGCFLFMVSYKEVIEKVNREWRAAQVGDVKEWMLYYSN